VRSLVALVATSLGSVAFQLSVALWPDKLQRYSWAVKYVWFGCILLWVIWIVTHPKLLGKSGPQIGPPAPTPININVNPNISPVIAPTISPTITATFGQSVKANRPKLTFLSWDTQPFTLDRWQSGFTLENHGEAALEVNVQRFEVSPGKYASSKTVATIPAHSQGFALVWLEGFSPFGFSSEKWNLLGAMKDASDARGGSPMYRPNYTIPIVASYRDFDDEWYESTADLNYVPTRNELVFGSTNQHSIKRPA
jgi:hypothetical protein